MGVLADALVETELAPPDVPEPDPRISNKKLVHIIDNYARTLL